MPTLGADEDRQEEREFRHLRSKKSALMVMNHFNDTALRHSLPSHMVSSVPDRKAFLGSIGSLLQSGHDYESLIDEVNTFFSSMKRKTSEKITSRIQDVSSWKTFCKQVFHGKK